MEKHAALEVVFICISFGLFAGYHLWLFWLAIKVFEKKTKSNMFYINRQARASWAYAVSRNTAAADQTYIVQTLRNSITASSLLATACSLIAVTGVGQIVVDGQKLTSLEALVRKDPILDGRDSLVSPALKLGIVEVMAWFTFLFFTQSIRLSVNMGFYARTVHDDENKGFYNEEELAAISKRAAICFTIAMRCFYAIIPLIFWVAGPTWMLSVSVLLVITLIMTDHIGAQEPRMKPKKKVEDIETGPLVEPTPADGNGKALAVHD